MASEPKDIIRIDNIKLLKVISDPTRKKIIDVLYDKPLTPSEIADKISYPKDKIYYHIKKLQTNGILIIAESEKVKGITQNKFINAAKKFEIDPTLIGEEIPKHLKGEDEVDTKKKEIEERNRVIYRDTVVYKEEVEIVYKVDTIYDIVYVTDTVITTVDNERKRKKKENQE